MSSRIQLLLEDEQALEEATRRPPTRATASRSTRGTAADRMSLRQHGSSWTTFVWDSFLLMFGGTQLGYAMGQMGWEWGLFWLTFSTTSTYVSGHLIGALVRETGAGSYPELGAAVLGRGGGLLVEFMQWAGYYLTGVVQIAFTGATWDQTFRGMAWAAPICTSQWMLLTVAVLLPLMQIPAFTQFGHLALVASIVTLYGTGVYLGQILSQGPYVAGRDALPGVSIPCYDQWTTTTMLATLPNMAFTFSGHGTFPEQIRELREPREFHRGFDVLYAVAVPFYAGCALLAFWAFGNMNSANNTENLKDDIWQRMAMFAALGPGFVNLVLGQIVLVLKIELPLGILPCDTWTSTSEAHLESRAAAMVRTSKVPPVLFRLVLRSLYLLSLLFFAEALIGAGLATYVNIAGALGLAAMTYWLPYVLWLCRATQQRDDVRRTRGSSSRGATGTAEHDATADGEPPPPAPSSCSFADEEAEPGFWSTRRALQGGPRYWLRVTLYVLAALGGLLISATGLYFNGKDLAKTDFKLFHPDSCKEGAHFWGDEMWDADLPRNASAYAALVIGCCANGTTCGS